MKRRVNLIPMAGAGQRFVDEGYSLPKPLIPIDGMPMILKAAMALPPADVWIFICRTEHLVLTPLRETLTEYFPGAQIVEVKELTAGQAATCLLARHLLQHDDELVIGACDNSMIYDHMLHEDLLKDNDALIWTFRHNPAVLQNPKMYGWVETGDNKKACRVSVKVPISTDPMNDHAVIGAFSFRRAGDFIQCADQMIAANRRINNEFYADEVMNVAIENGLTTVVMEAESYVCFGTPRDLNTYNYWRHIFKHSSFQQ